MFRALLATVVSAVAVHAACPGGGLLAHGRCWYLSQAGASCGTTCAGKGLTYSHYVAGEDQPMLPRLLGRNPATKQFAWGRIECYVASADRYHPAKAAPNSNTGDNGEASDWSVDVCELACACAEPEASTGSADYPACAQRNEVLRHAGAHAIFVDLSSHGAAGCWQNDCTNTDKFNAADMGICARTCSQTEECTHWSYGEQDGTAKCFFRKSDGGREQADGWVSGTKACAPPSLPDAFVALTSSEVLLPCDGGKSDACPDMARAVTTWKFAIKHLKRATEGKLDANTMNFINQVSGDTDAFAAQMSEENFPVIAANNRQVFQALQGWLLSQPKAEVDPNDASLPQPLRGSLCGASHCYEEL
uniref:Apple domain-containing protein n=1 Tax=Alexandrium monilatum TaxID=311494 RepID=A0A7S4RYR7_9DINO